jgi:hypothetical protein
MVWAKLNPLIFLFLASYIVSLSFAYGDKDFDSYDEESSEILLSDNPDIPPFPRDPESQLQLLKHHFRFEKAWDRISPAAAKRIELIFNSCLRAQKRTFQIEYAGPNGLTERRTSSFISESLRKAKNRIKHPLGLRETSAQKDEKFNPTTHSSQDSEQEDLNLSTAPVTHIMDTLILHKVRTANLDAKQSVALAICAASNAYNYKLTGRTVFSSALASVEKTWNQSSGICWDYTRLTAHLLKVINRELQKRQMDPATRSARNELYFRTTSNIPHSFVEVRFAETGTWLGADPTPTSINDLKRSGVSTLIDPSLPNGTLAHKKW